VAEFLLIGALAGLFAAVGASAVGSCSPDRCSTCRTASMLGLLVGLVAGAIGVAIAGLLGTAKVLRTLRCRCSAPAHRRIKPFHRKDAKNAKEYGQRDKRVQVVHTRIPDNRDEGEFCILQLFLVYFSAFLCVLCVFAVKVRL